MGFLRQGGSTSEQDRIFLDIPLHNQSDLCEITFRIFVFSVELICNACIMSRRHSNAIEISYVLYYLGLVLRECGSDCCCFFPGEFGLECCF